MEKWADYLISAVRYDDDHTHITHLKRHADDGETVGKGESIKRLSIVTSIDSGNTYCTITKSSNDKWQKGDDIHIFKVNKEKYLRTDGNSNTGDNLGSLPEY